MLRYLLLLLSTLLFAPATLAVDEKDLLPIDQAFVLSTQVVARDKIEFTWKVAPGYYLYKHRMGVSSVDGKFKTNALQLPEGVHKKDQFFGDVQTYRGTVVGIQTGTVADNVGSVSFLVKYQGCADLGVCYPPHKKTITLSLPEATQTDLNTLNSNTLNLNANKKSDLFGGTKITTDSMPLPAEQAFQFEAIVNTSNELLLRFTPAPARAGSAPRPCRTSGCRRRPGSPTCRWSPARWPGTWPARRPRGRRGHHRQRVLPGPAAPAQRLRPVDAPRRAGGLPEGLRADRADGRHLPRRPRRGSRGRFRRAVDVAAAGCRRGRSPLVLRAARGVRGDRDGERRAPVRRAASGVDRDGRRPGERARREPRRQGGRPGRARHARAVGGAGRRLGGAGPRRGRLLLRRDNHPAVGHRRGAARGRRRDARPRCLVGIWHRFRRFQRLKEYRFQVLRMTWIISYRPMDLLRKYR